jgi:hypothetical protein
MANKGRRTGVKSKCRANQLALYKSLDKRTTNKIRKLKRHIKSLPNDIQAKKVLETYTK